MPREHKGLLDIANMTPEQQRIAIAEDVVAQVRAGVFIAEQGEYFHPKGPRGVIKRFTTWVAKLKPCEVCGIGAACVSSVRLFDDWNGETHVGDVCHPEPMREHLSRFFSDAQIGLIEVAFEGDGYFYAQATGRHRWARSEDEEQQVKYAQQWHYHCEEPAHLLIAIFDNIARNGGTFKPEQMPADSTAADTHT